MNNISKNNISIDDLLKELEFVASRSSGKGGQNVNKVSTKITLIFDVEKSGTLTSNLKNLIKSRLSNRINSKGQLRLSVSKERFQYRNKSLAIKKFLELLNDALEPEEIRIRTKPGKKSIEKRLHNKSVHSEKKRLRGSKPEME